MPWYKNSKLQSVGLVILALLATQILQVILFLIFSIGSRNIPSSQGWLISLLTVLPVIAAVVAGGAFLGRLRPIDAMPLWSASAVANGLIPIVIQAALYPDTLAGLGSLVQWTTVIGNILFWFVGCVLGSFSQQKTPNSAFDRSLVQWTAGISSAIALLYGLTWGSIVFSEGYRLAKTVELPLPDGVEEIKIRVFEPGIAKARRFKTIVGSGNTDIQDYFSAKMTQDGWTDITELFQSWPIAEWRFETEIVDDRSIDYAVSGGHWQDLSGKVAVTLALQSEKVDITKGWDETDWSVSGIVLSRPHSEPQNRPALEAVSEAELEAEDADTGALDELEDVMSGDLMQGITE